MGDDQFEIISFENETTEPNDPAPATERSGPSLFRLTALSVAGFAFAVGLALLLFPSNNDEPDDATSTTTTTTTTAPPPFSREVFQLIAPSVVVIQTESEDPENAEGGLGTGVIINADGTVLTAHHVIDNASAIHLSYPDGTVTTATVVQRDRANDIAVLAPDQVPQFIVPAVLGGGVQVGDEAYAVGHPLGLTASLSAGVISGLDRNVPVDDNLTLEGLIQFDTAVNPGNSGGPLLDRDGRVVGIVTALANPNEDASFSGIGFAIPIPAGGGGIGPGQ